MTLSPRRAGRGQHLQLRDLADRAGAGHGRRSRRRPAAGLYLARALAVGEAPRSRWSRRQSDALSDDDLRRSAVIVLNDVVVQPSQARRLQRYVEQGGGLFVAAGQRANWPAEVDLLPGTIESAVDRTRGDAARVGALEYAHPVFEPFRAPRSGNFSRVPVYRYRKITPAADAQVLAKFDGTAPAVLERRRRQRPRAALGVGARHVLERPADAPASSCPSSISRCATWRRTPRRGHG